MLLAACTAPQHREIDNNRGLLPPQAFIDNVPFYPQEEHYCGPAALAMILTWAGIPSSQADIATQVYTPGREGSLPNDMLAGARRNGALAMQVSTLSDLLTEIAAGHPVLVFQNLGLSIFPRWHYAVVIGYGLNEDTIILHSGLNERHAINLTTFENTWRRADYWALTITAPSDLPVTAKQQDILKAVSGLERSQKYEAAREAYTTIMKRWESNTTAYFGLANANYLLGQYEESLSAYRQLLSIDPNHAPAWNNMAYTFLKLHRYDEALAAANKAVITGQKKAIYQETLADIEKSIGKLGR